MTKQPEKYSIDDFGAGSIAIRHKLIDRDYRQHWHECCELEMILSGRGSQILNGVGYPLSKGEIYMLTPADCHSIHVDEPLDIIGIMFDERMITPSVYEQILTHETMGANLTANFAGRSFTAAKALLDALIAGTQDTAVPDGNEYMYMCHIIDCLLIQLLRCFRSDGRKAGKSPVGTAILYLHSHYMEDLTLDEVAGITHLSRNYFSELFRESTGKTFKSYLIDLRMRAACRMLANSDMSVTDICFACGFESFSNFMRTFKSRFGVSPLKFRQDNRGRPCVSGERQPQ